MSTGDGDTTSDDDEETMRTRRQKKDVDDLRCSRRSMVLIAVAWLATLVVAWLIGHDTVSPGLEARALHDGHGLYDVYQDYFRRAKYIDLTHSISPTTPVWPGFGPSAVNAGVAGQAIKGFVKKGDKYSYEGTGFITTSYHLTTDQLGTQLDPPAHWNEFGATISDIPATFAVRPLVVIDIHEKVAKTPNYTATVDDVLAWEKVHGTVPAGSVVMFRSDWSRRWDDFAKNGLPGQYPGVGLAVLKMLHGERGILFHGHEPLDTDMTPSLEGEAWLMHNNFAQAEGVTNLDKVSPSGCLITIGFAKLQGGTGGYARYVAICPFMWEHGDSIDDVPGAPLERQAHPLRRKSSGVLEPDPMATPTPYCNAPNSVALGCQNGDTVWQ